MAQYYGIEEAVEYLAHYGRRGMRKGQHLPDIKKFQEVSNNMAGLAEGRKSAGNTTVDETDETGSSDNDHRFESRERAQEAYLNAKEKLKRLQSYRKARRSPLLGPSYVRRRLPR